MSRITIEQALDAQLQTVTGVGDVVVGGQVYAPQRNKPYVKGRVSAYNRQPAGMGVAPVFQINGTYQVDVVRPAYEGKVAAGQIAAKIVAAFPRSTALTTTDGHVISLLTASETSEQDAADWIMVPVLIQFFASEP